MIRFWFWNQAFFVTAVLAAKAGVAPKAASPTVVRTHRSRIRFVTARSPFSARLREGHPVTGMVRDHAAARPEPRSNPALERQLRRTSQLLIGHQSDVGRPYSFVTRRAWAVLQRSRH